MESANRDDFNNPRGFINPNCANRSITLNKIDNPGLVETRHALSLQQPNENRNRFNNRGDTTRVIKFDRINRIDGIGKIVMISIIPMVYKFQRCQQ